MRCEQSAQAYHFYRSIFHVRCPNWYYRGRGHSTGPIIDTREVFRLPSISRTRRDSPVSSLLVGAPLCVAWVGWWCPVRPGVLCNWAGGQSDVGRAVDPTQGLGHSTSSIFEAPSTKYGNRQAMVVGVIQCHMPSFHCHATPPRHSGFAVERSCTRQA